jgi:hypothetical protein
MDGARVEHDDCGKIGHSLWRPADGETVYVAKLGDPRPGSSAKTCSPGTKRIRLVAREVVIFDDLTHAPIDKCFPLTDAGRKACEVWCQQIERMKEFEAGVVRQYSIDTRRS